MKGLFLPSCTQENLYKEQTIISFGYIFSCCNVASLKYNNFLQEKKYNYPVLFSVYRAFRKILFLLIRTQIYKEYFRNEKEKIIICLCTIQSIKGRKTESIHSFHIKCRETFGLLTSGLVFVFGFMQHNTELCAEYITG